MRHSGKAIFWNLIWVRNLLRWRNHQRIRGNILLLLGLILDLSIDLSNSIWHFKISSAHVYSSTVDFSDLNLSDQLLSNLLVKVPYKSEAPTRFSERISNDLTLFDFAKLLKVAPKTLVSEIVV
jgi:hypothetical protein